MTLKPPGDPNAVLAESGLYRYDLVDDFGAYGDGVTDDWPAFQAAADAVKASPSGAIIEIPNPPVSYRISQEIDCFIPASSGKRQIWRGQDDALTVIRPDFAGRDKALFRFVDSTGSSSTDRHSTVQFQGGMYLRHMSQSVAHPVFIWIHGAGEFQQRGMLRMGGSNNTALRLNSPQNMRADLIYNTFGGHVWTYKALDDVTITLAGTTTVTAGSAVFSADDVGKTFWLHRTTADLAKHVFTVATYVDPTHITVDRATPAAGTYRAFFAPPSISVGSGATTATVDGDGCFVAGEDEGTRIYIGQDGGDLFQTTIESVTNATTVEIADPAPAAITDQPFCTPGVEITGWDFPSGSGVATDIRIKMLHIEDATAVPLLLQDCAQTWIHSKIENESTPEDSNAADGAIWVNDVEGGFEGDLSGTNCGRHRIVVWGQEHPFDIHVKTRRAQGEVLARLYPFSNDNGVVRLTGPAFINSDTVNPWTIADDDNAPADPRFVVTGPVDTDTTTERTRIALGNPETLWAELDGSIFIDDLSGSLGSIDNRFNKIYLAHHPFVRLRALSSSTTVNVLGTDAVLVFDATSGPITATLLSAAVMGVGRSYTITRTNAGANLVTVVPAGAETIGGATSIPLTFRGARLKIISDGTNWRIEYAPSASDRRRRAGMPSAAIRDTFDRSVAEVSSAVLVSGRLELDPIWLEGGDVLTGIAFVTGATSGSSLTHCAFSLYDTDAVTLLKKTTDDTGTGWSNQSLRALAWSGGGTYTVPVDGFYFLGVQVVGTTMPSLYSSACASTITAFSPVLTGTSTSGLTDGNPPNPAAAMTAKTGVHYAYVY